MNIAFIGLGIMGKPMALNLVKAGHALFVVDIVPSAVQALTEKGAVACATPKEAARQAELVITMLPNSPHVRQVIEGEGGILEGLRPGAIVVDMSSIDPNVSIDLEKKVKAKGGEMIDAPVSGGEPKAIDGTVSFMCGGNPAAFERVKPVLASMGASVVLVGDIGSGNMTKLANQIIVAGNIAAMSEAFTLAAKSGVDPEKVFEAIRGGLAGSTVLNAKAPMILNRNFQPGFRMELHIKDLKNAVAAAEAVEMVLPLTEQVLGEMTALDAKGYGKLDHGALVRFYEEKEGVEVKKP